MSSPANEQRPQAAESNHAPKTQAHQRRRRPGRAGPAADAAGLERTGPPEDRRGRAVGRRAHDTICDDGCPQGSGEGLQAKEQLMTAQEIGAYIGKAIARDVKAEGMPRAWTGLDPQDADQLSTAGIEFGTSAWVQAETAAEAAYYRTLHPVGCSCGAPECPE